MRIVRVFRILLVAAVLISGALVARPYVRGLSFVVRAADLHGPVRRVADWGVRVLHEQEVTIPLADGPIRGREYIPSGSSARAVLLVSGLHVAGIDEPRLVHLARDVAATGLTVVTPDIPALVQFDITPRLTDDIEQSGVWLASRSGLSPDGRIGMMGISFSGGLSLVAAGRRSLAGHVAYAFSLGGHDDLPRVLRYLCTGTEPLPPRELGMSSGETFVRAPHDYGVAVILLGVADRLVPPSQVEPLRAAVRQFLRASADDGVDKGKAAEEFAALRQTARSLPRPAATLLGYVNDRDVVHLGARLLPYIEYYGSSPALSLSKSPKPSAPVFLLHGSDDNVIPPIEAEYLANDLRGYAPVRLLLSGLISHAAADRPMHFGDVMQLASFWGDVVGR